jgi:hypothetical protein
MVFKLDPENLARFVEMLEEEHTINNNLISTIYDILMEATGYVEVHVEETDQKRALTKKQKEKAILKRRKEKFELRK